MKGSLPVVVGNRRVEGVDLYEKKLEDGYLIVGFDCTCVYCCV